eukprot:6180138-Pleurochrysis_carterae.AAC.2
MGVALADDVRPPPEVAGIVTIDPAHTWAAGGEPARASSRDCSVPRAADGPCPGGAGAPRRADRGASGGYGRGVGLQRQRRLRIP